MHPCRRFTIYEQHKEQIDLIILDLIMPVMDGPETFERLRKLNPEAKVLLSSGYSKDEKIDELLDRGAVGFLEKPFDMGVLSAQLKRAFK